MQLIKKTVSFCPTCYKRIPAEVGISDGVVAMEKRCDIHGHFSEVVESDVGFYLQCLNARAPFFYPGYFLDVTKRCNLKCKYCYYEVEQTSKDRSVDSILSEAAVHAPMAPIILTGGEPTLRKDLVGIVKAVKDLAPVELLTNGTGLGAKTLDALIPLLSVGNTVSINLSMHQESNGADYATVEAFKERGLKLESVLFVIDDLDQIDGILSYCESNKDAIEAVRIKAATNLWAEQKSAKKIFVSDMVNRMKRHGAEPIWWRPNKTSFFNMQLGGIYYMLVSWYDAYNVDLFDIACPPFYKAKTGAVENIVTANIINEGIMKGWLDGEKLKG